MGDNSTSDRGAAPRAHSPKPPRRHTHLLLLATAIPIFLLVYRGVMLTESSLEDLANFDAIVTAWRHCGVTLEAAWQFIVASPYATDFNMYVLGSFALHLAVYWTLGLLFTYVDLTQSPKSIWRYKVQPEANAPLRGDDLRKCIRQVLFNQFVVHLLAAVVFFPLHLRCCGPIGRHLPSMWIVVRDCVAFVLIEEIGFYYGHRLMHYGSFYRRFHKIHHEWQAPIALVCIYAHPIEHFLCNLFPVAVGPLLMGSHISLSYFWQIISVYTTICSHCGYHLPLQSSPQAHDYHHLKFNSNFGVLGILDWLHGTAFGPDVIQQTQHKVLLSLTPFPPVQSTKQDTKTDL